MRDRFLPWALVMALVLASCARGTEAAPEMIDIGMIAGLGRPNSEFVIATLGRNYTEAVKLGTELVIRSAQSRELRARVVVDRRMDDMVALRIVEWLGEERVLSGDVVSMEVSASQ